MENPKVYKHVILTYDPQWHKTEMAILMRGAVQLLIRRSHKMAGKWEACAELTEQGILHFHWIGEITDSNRFKLFLQYWRRTYGFIKLVDTKNLQGAWNYVTKEKHDCLRKYYEQDVPDSISNANYCWWQDFVKKPVCNENVVTQYSILDYWL